MGHGHRLVAVGHDDQAGVVAQAVAVIGVDRLALADADEAEHVAAGATVELGGAAGQHQQISAVAADEHARALRALERLGGVHLRDGGDLGVLGVGGTGNSDASGHGGSDESLHDVLLGREN